MIYLSLDLLARRDKYIAERNQSRQSHDEANQNNEVDLENLESLIAPKKDQDSNENSKEENQDIPELEQVDDKELIEVKINNQQVDKSSIFSQKNHSESSI